MSSNECALLKYVQNADNFLSGTQGKASVLFGTSCVLKAFGADNSNIEIKATYYSLLSLQKVIFSLLKVHS